MFIEIIRETEDPKEQALLQRGQNVYNKLTTDDKSAMKDAMNTVGDIMHKQAQRDKLKAYIDADKRMDDIASELTAKSGVDVRQYGVDKAIEKLMSRASNNEDKTQITDWLIQYRIAENDKAHKEALF